LYKTLCGKLFCILTWSTGHRCFKETKNNKKYNIKNNHSRRLICFLNLSFLNGWRCPVGLAQASCEELGTSHSGQKKGQEMNDTFPKREGSLIHVHKSINSTKKNIFLTEIRNKISHKNITWYLIDTQHSFAI